MKIVGSVYNGSRYVDGTGELTSVRGDISAKGEVKAIVNIPVNDRFATGPVAGVQIEELFRSLEYWTIVTTKIGLKSSYNTFSFEAGVSKPIFTVDHYFGVDNATYNTNPVGQISPYAEVRFKITRGKTIHLYYEQTHWGCSKLELRHTPGATSASSTVVTNGAVFQPNTFTSTAGVLFDWKF